MTSVESRKTGEVRLLEQWIDGTSVESEQAAEGGYDVTASGFTWHLYESCLKLLKNIIQLEGQNIGLETRPLRECLSRLFLWGEGFGGGQLDKVIQRSDSLKGTILQFVSAIAKILLDKLVPQLRLSPMPLEVSKLTKELRPLVEKVDSITTGDSDDSEEDFNDSESDVASVISSPGGLPRDAARNINSYVSCLMGLLPSMEHTLNVNEEQGTAVPTPIEFHVSNAALTYVYNVHDKYKNADRRLVSRLGEANFQRHVAVRQKMAQKEKVIEILVEVEPAPKSAFIPTSVFHDSGFGSMPAGSNLAPTIASHSSFKTDGSQGGKRSFRVPEAPPNAYEGVPFPCSICGHLLKNIKNRYDWKVHVFADLQPYICTFSECADSLLTFPTRKLWQDHEFSQHRVEISWACPVCKAELSSPEEWNEHVERNHRYSLTDVEVRYAFAAARRTRAQPIERQKCPLCLTVCGTNQRAFTTHVCKHLESIALAALPNEATSDSENQSVSDHESTASAHEPLSKTKNNDHVSEPTKGSKLEHFCPLITCEHHKHGFAQMWDQHLHILTHYKGNMVCRFCPGSETTAEVSFDGVDVFKRHLIEVHEVEPNTPTTNVTTLTPGVTAKCFSCPMVFDNPQAFYLHLDDCIMRALLREEPFQATGLAPENPQPIQAKQNKHEWILMVFTNVSDSLIPNEAEMTRLFSTYGKVEECRIPVKQNTKERKRLVYIQMATAEGAKAAIEGIDGQLVEGQPLHVQRAALDSIPVLESTRHEMTADAIIHGLPSNTNEASLRAMMGLSNELVEANFFTKISGDTLSARLFFKSYAGAVHARNTLNGELNAAGSRRMTVEITQARRVNEHDHGDERDENSGAYRSSDLSGSEDGVTYVSTHKLKEPHGTGNLTTRTSPPRKLTTREDANFQCQVKDCGKLFKRSYNFKAHMETHDPSREYPFPCSVEDCDKKFVRKTDLQRHHQEAHSKGAKHRCDYCSRHFWRKDTLRRHMEDNCPNRFNIGTVDLQPQIYDSEILESSEIPKDPLIASSEAVSSLLALKKNYGTRSKFPGETSGTPKEEVNTHGVKRDHLNLFNLLSGLRLVVTLSSPPGTQYRGIFYTLVPKRSLTLQNVTVLGNGEHLTEITVTAAEVIDIVEYIDENTTRRVPEVDALWNDIFGPPQAYKIVHKAINKTVERNVYTEDTANDGQFISSLNLPGPGSQPGVSDQSVEAKESTSSYWSVPEQQEFPTLLEYYGTNWHAIANIMTSKTHIMVRNYYQRHVDNGMKWWEDIAQGADMRRFRGESMGPEPKKGLYYDLKINAGSDSQFKQLDQQRNLSTSLLNTSLEPPVAPVAPSMKDGSSGPKIWTGTEFLPRFVRQADVPGEGMCFFYDDGTHCKAFVDGEPVNAHLGVTKFGKPRKRLATACVTCREKKIKCDPGYPCCTQCEKSGRICKFGIAHPPGLGSNDEDSQSEEGFADGLPSLNGEDEELPPLSNYEPMESVTLPPIKDKSNPKSYGLENWDDPWANAAIPPTYEYPSGSLHSWYTGDDTSDETPGYNKPQKNQKLDRTMTDTYADGLYNPRFQTSSTNFQDTAARASMHSPPNDVFSQRLQAANDQHMNATNKGTLRTDGERSPFRQGSPLAPTGNMSNLSNPRFASASHMREQQKAQNDADALLRQMDRASSSKVPTTDGISPNDISLVYDESEDDSKMPPPRSQPLGMRDRNNPKPRHVEGSQSKMTSSPGKALDTAVEAASDDDFENPMKNVGGMKLLDFMTRDNSGLEEPSDESDLSDVPDVNDVEAPNNFPILKDDKSEARRAAGRAWRQILSRDLGVHAILNPPGDVSLRSSKDNADEADFIGEGSSRDWGRNAEMNPGQPFSALDIDNTARDHPLYHNVSAGPDAFYHCPWEGHASCQHKPEKLKCNYDKLVDFHLKPYRCKVVACELHFSSAACLLRHEREAHAMHGHGDKLFLCTYNGCERSVPGMGFPRHWNLQDHLKRVHNAPPPSPPQEAAVNFNTSQAHLPRRSESAIHESRDSILYPHELNLEQSGTSKRGVSDWLNNDFDHLEKYNHLEGGDEVLPLYGESGSENEYDDETWAKLKSEGFQDTTTKSLNDAQAAIFKNTTAPDRGKRRRAAPEPPDARSGTRDSAPNTRRRPRRGAAPSYTSKAPTRGPKSRSDDEDSDDGLTISYPPEPAQKASAAPTLFQMERGEDLDVDHAAMPGVGDGELDVDLEAELEQALEDAPGGGEDSSESEEE